MVQLATRVDEESAAEFKRLTKMLGTTPADAMRMFVKAFNSSKGFPYDVVVNEAEPFETDEEAKEFIQAKTRRVLDDAW